MSADPLGRWNMPHQWTLRRAANCDRAFLFRLHEMTMRGVIEQTWGWDEQWQERDFERRFSSAPYYILESESGQPIGTLCVEHRADCHYILELQLLPEVQGRGIGTAVVQMVIENAQKESLPVRLSVVPANERARRLYERLGFRVAAVEPPFIRMAREDGRSSERPN